MMCATIWCWFSVWLSFLSEVSLNLSRFAVSEYENRLQRLASIEQYVVGGLNVLSSSNSCIHTSIYLPIYLRSNVTINAWMSNPIIINAPAIHGWLCLWLCLFPFFLQDERLTRTCSVILRMYACLIFRLRRRSKSLIRGAHLPS